MVITENFVKKKKFEITLQLYKVGLFPIKLSS